MNHPTAEILLKQMERTFVPTAGPVLYWRWVVANKRNIVAAVEALGLEPPDFGPNFHDQVQELVQPVLVARQKAEQWFDSLPGPQNWQKRKWLRCQYCGQVASYDYQPFSLSTPIIAFPCGHGLTERLSEFTDQLSEAEARQLLIERKVAEILADVT